MGALTGQRCGFAQHLLLVRDGKGEKDRITMLPETQVAPLQEHLGRVQQLHTTDLAESYGAVYLPYALERKYPHANREWGWQYVFPAKSRSVAPRTGTKCRHHLDESSLQKAVRAAARLAGIAKHVTCHTFRHSFAMQLLEAGYDIRTACLVPNPIRNASPKLDSATACPQHILSVKKSGAPRRHQ